MAKSTGNKKKSNEDENVHKGHRGRLKRSFLANGADSFYDHQVLELLLFYSIPQVDTNPTAHRLMNRFGSIAGIFNADYHELMNVQGVGESTACLLKLIPELFVRYLKSSLSEMRLDSTQAFCKYFLYKLSHLQNEQLWVICLDDKLNLVCDILISDGNGSSVNFNLSKIICEVESRKCTSCVMSHNHPFGDTEPSDDDIRLTELAVEGLKNSGIDLIDHIIVSRREARSLFHNEIVTFGDDFKEEERDSEN